MKTLLWVVAAASRTLRWLATAAAITATVVLLARVGLHFSSPQAWRGWTAVKVLRTHVDPVLVASARWLGIPPSHKGAVEAGLPIALIVVILVARALVAAGTRRLQDAADRALDRRPAAAARPAEPSPPAPTLRSASSTDPQRSPGPEPQTDDQPSDDMLVTIADASGPPPGYERIGRYHVETELGHGAMGVVYKATDPQIGRTVAIKSILSSALDTDELAEYKERFAREARAAGQLSHPRIVSVFDILEDRFGRPCMVMEYVEGPNLRALAAAGPILLDRALEITIQAAQALDYAHSCGVVHRDIKPANILIGAEGRIKITDFGIAKIPGARLTQTGQILGTPAFMSPEQLTASPVDGRSDLFSLGAVLYWMVTGEVPFPGDTITAVAVKVLQEDPPSVRTFKPDLPEALEAIIRRCLAKEPSRRYATGRALAEALQALRAAGLR